MNPERIAELDRIGFCWEIRPNGEHAYGTPTGGPVAGKPAAASSRKRSEDKEAAKKKKAEEAKEAKEAAAEKRREKLEKKEAKKKKAEEAKKAAAEKRREKLEKKEAEKMKSGICGQIEVLCSRYFSRMKKAEKETDPASAEKLREEAEGEKAKAYELHRVHNCRAGLTEDDAKRDSNQFGEELFATEQGKTIEDFAKTLGALTSYPTGADGGKTAVIGNYPPIKRFVEKDGTIRSLDVGTDPFTSPMCQFIEEYLRQARWGSSAECREKAREIVSGFKIVDICPFFLDREMCRGSRFLDLVLSEMRDASIDFLVAFLLKMPNVKQVVTIGSEPARMIFE